MRGVLLLADSHLRDSVSGVVDAAFILADVSPVLPNDRGDSRALGLRDRAERLSQSGRLAGLDLLEGCCQIWVDLNLAPAWGNLDIILGNEFIGHNLLLSGRP